MVRSGRKQKLALNDDEKMQAEIASGLRIKCTGMCGKYKYAKEFITCTSLEQGIVPWCRNCLTAYIRKPNGTWDINRLKEFLKEIDIPFNGIAWEKSMQMKLPVQEYFALYDLLHFTETSMSGASAAPVVESIVETDEDDCEDVCEVVVNPDELKSVYGNDGKVIPALVEKWQTTKDTDVHFLEREFNRWAANRDVSDNSICVLIKEICYNQLALVKARQANDQKTIDSTTKRLQDLMGSANLKPVQDTSNAGDGTISFGLFIKDVEETEPIPEWDMPDYMKDLSTWIIGQLGMMSDFSNATVDEYKNALKDYTIDPNEEDDDG